MVARAPMPRPGSDARTAYVDLLRGASIAAVVVGHWLATGVQHRDGHLVGVDALGVVSWGSWATLVLQVIPLFFLVGGYANAASWLRHSRDGTPWQAWVSDRVRRLLIPTFAYLIVMAALLFIGRLAGADARDIQQAGWALALHLWFLAAYLAVLLCVPALYAAHRRWSLLVPAVMAALAVVIGAGVVAYDWQVVGWANYLLVWGCFHQLGFAWRDGLLTDGRAGPALAVAAVFVLVMLIWWGPYPVSMVGVPGARINNPSPPSPALLAFGLVQCGLALTFQPVADRWLGRHPRLRSAIHNAGGFTMPVYLWHMVPVVVVVSAGYLSVVGQRLVGSVLWWEQRPLWIVTLSLVLAALLVALGIVVRLVGRIPVTRGSASAGTAHPTRPGSAIASMLLTAAVAVSCVAIARVAIRGVAPHGQVDLRPLLAVGIALALVTTSTHDTRRRRSAAPDGPPAIGQRADTDCPEADPC